MIDGIRREETYPTRKETARRPTMKEKEKKNLLVAEESAHQKTFNKIECGLVEKKDWVKDKSAIVPWAFLDAYNPTDPGKESCGQR